MENKQPSEEELAKVMDCFMGLLWEKGLLWPKVSPLDIRQATGLHEETVKLCTNYLVVEGSIKSDPELIMSGMFNCDVRGPIPGYDERFDSPEIHIREYFVATRNGLAKYGKGREVKDWATYEARRERALALNEDMSRI